MWNEILTSEDISKLMEIFGGFHDSCMKEMKYISGAFVDSDLRMQAMNNKRIAKIIFQRQYKNPSTIEMEFSEVEKLKLPPSDEQYSCEIFDVTCTIENDCIFWYDSSGCVVGYEHDGMWICAKKARWRPLD